ncbi:MAG: PfkB family carbohydrate kinase [Ferruginibacter sp.]
MANSILCIGSVLVDELYFSNESLIQGTSNPSTLVRKPGGVITNIARHLGLLGHQPQLITVFGQDADAAWLKYLFSNEGVSTHACITLEQPTGRYASFLQPDGQLYAAVCTDTIETSLDKNRLSDLLRDQPTPDWIIADCNLSVEALSFLAEYALEKKAHLVIEPVSVPKAKKIAAIQSGKIFMITPNQDEWAVIEHWAAAFGTDLSRIERVWVSQGERGSVMKTVSTSMAVPSHSIQVVDSTGAGDAMLAAWLHATLTGQNEVTAIQYAHTLALEVLQQQGAVCEWVDVHTLNERKHHYYS